MSPPSKDAMDMLPGKVEAHRWQMALWFSCENEWLDGKTPLAVWPDDRQAVLEAARSENALFHG